MRRGTLLGIAIPARCLAGCASEDDVATTGAGGAGGAGVGGSGAAGGGGALPATAPIEASSYPDGAGQFILATVAIDDSPSFGVLLDTGSDGLRVFASALARSSLPGR